jgi:hypothetical protein
LAGLAVGFAASILVGAVIYAVNGEEHAVGAGVWVGVGLFIGTPIAAILGSITGRRVALRRIETALERGPIPPRPD